MKILLTSTSFQDTPGKHHDALLDTGYKIDKIRGMNITVVTTAETDEQSFELLNSIGFPFRRTLQANNTEAQA